MGNKERLAWVSVLAMLGVLLFWSMMAYDVLATHVVKLNYAYQTCLEIKLGETE